MGFNIKHGGIESIIKLAQLTGEARAGQEQQRVALDIAMNLRRERMNVEMVEYQQELQQEAKRQSMAWELQKIQLSQQNDFQIREQLRMQEMQDEYNKQQRKEQEFDAVIKAIDDSDTITDDEKERFKLNAEAKHRMGPSAPQIKEPKGIDPMKMQRGMEDDLMYYQEIVNQYSETEDISWMPGSLGLGPTGLAKKVVVGKKVTWEQATEQDKAIYQYAQTQLAMKIQQLRGAGPDMFGGPGDVLGLGGIGEGASGMPDVNESMPEQGYGSRADGTQKGSGFFGELKLAGGGIATEYSIGVEFDGKETQIPSLVPTLTEQEKNLMVNDIIPNRKPVPKAIVQKAVDYAKKRLQQGKSPFAQEGEQSTDSLGMRSFRGFSY
ncbi:hypothetical protein LCGC14_2184740 [marine sediment metagenome]|uniref:Uncharacterized protein n=1 Tax=marine sediment metagenome TaxID=412755 RepID=A0A0F9DL62_9ZZZZ